jgi:2-oxoglutarate ferredoxin oxidoreductase subunit alpha
LRFVLHAGHGEFPRFVVAPGDIDECFACAADALNLSWKYQVPSIVLTDKHLAESFSSVSLDRASKGPDFGKRQEGGEGYVRYKITEDGISPMVFPGAEDTVVKVTSYEHNEEGEATEHTHEIMAMHEKRSRKGEGLVREVQWFPTVKTYGDPTSDIVLLFWGSTKGAVLEAMRLLPQKVRAVQVLWMEPFDTERVSRELSGARVVVGIEANHTAQLCSLLRERTGISVSHTIRKYDALPFTPRELADDIIHLIF